MRYLGVDINVQAMARAIVLTGGLLVAAPSASADSFYVSGALGAAFFSDATATANKGALSDFSVEYETGFSVAGALGYEFSNGIRVEGELDYSRVELDQISQAGVQNSGNGNVSTVTGMINGIYGLKLNNFTPYLGGGVGFAKFSFDSSTTANFNAVDDKDTVFAYQVLAGIEKKLGDSIKLGVGYKFVRYNDVGLRDVTGITLDSDQNVHKVEVRVRYSF